MIAGIRSGTRYLGTVPDYPPHLDLLSTACQTTGNACRHVLASFTSHDCAAKRSLRYYPASWWDDGDSFSGNKPEVNGPNAP